MKPRPKYRPSLAAIMAACVTWIALAAFVTLECNH